MNEVSIQELSFNEVNYVSGAGFAEGVAAIGGAAGIAVATISGGLESIAAGVALVAAPFAVAGIAALIMVGAHRLWRVVSLASLPKRLILDLDQSDDAVCSQQPSA